MTRRHQSSRREFLQGKAAAQAIGDLADEIVLGQPGQAASEEPTAGPYLVQLARRAMACQFEFFLNAGQYPQGAQAALLALDLVEQLEDQLSVYRPHSEVSRLNAEAAHQPREVEPRLFRLLQLAVEIHGQTQGAFDITAGPLSEAWGFTRRAGVLPDESKIAAALARVGTRWLDLNGEHGTVEFRHSGVQINLGAIGKGYALDRAAETLLTAGVDDFLLHGGHSSVLARGCLGSRSPAEGWLVGVRHPLRPERRLGQLRVVNRAVATSGSGTQFFEHEGRRFGHILDPRTGWPAEGVLSTTVLAPTAAVADALSTAFYVLGPDTAARFCADHPDVAGLIISPGDRVGTVRIDACGFGPDEWLVCEQ